MPNFEAALPMRLIVQQSSRIVSATGDLLSAHHQATCAANSNAAELKQPRGAFFPQLDPGVYLEQTQWEALFPQVLIVVPPHSLVNFLLACSLAPSHVRADGVVLRPATFLKNWHEYAHLYSLLDCTSGGERLAGGEPGRPQRLRAGLRQLLHSCSP
jgi:hypothetical protein